MKYSYQRRNKADRKNLVAILIMGIIIGTLGSYYYFTNYYYTSTPSTPTSSENNYIAQEPTYSRAQINLVAVDQNGNGVSTPLIVESKPGTGKALTDVDKLLFWVDTQQSIQIAKAVAENVTGINASNVDITYTIETNASLIGGPSAGGALTVATIAVLKNEKLRSDVVMTGTINEDGTIGQIGGVLEKAKAAKEVGAKLFLVPLGQGTQTFLQPQENCTKRANFLFCETTYKEVTINIGKDAGIPVIEIANITEAYNYFKL